MIEMREISLKIKLPGRHGGWWLAISWIPRRVARWGFGRFWNDGPFYSFCLWRLNIYWWWRSENG